MNNAVADFMGKNAAIFKRHPKCTNCNPRCIHQGRVDDEDAGFANQLRQVMLALPACPPQLAEAFLASLQPTRYFIRSQEWPIEERLCWLTPYWNHIADELWAYYRGDYCDFVTFRNSGSDLLCNYVTSGNVEERLEEYAVTAKRFMRFPGHALTACLKCPVKCAYGALVSRRVSRVDVLDRIKRWAGSSRADRVEVISGIIADYARSILRSESSKDCDELLGGLTYCITTHVTDRTTRWDELQEELIKNALTQLTIEGVRKWK